MLTAFRFKLIRVFESQSVKVLSKRNSRDPTGRFRYGFIFMKEDGRGYIGTSLFKQRLVTHTSAIGFIGLDVIESLESIYGDGPEPRNLGLIDCIYCPR